MIGFLEGRAASTASSTATCTAATSSCRPDGRTALLDFGITGRLSHPAAARVPAAAHLRHHERRHRPARRDARPRGPAPRCRHRRGVVRDLGLDKPPIDPTQLDARRAHRRVPAGHQGADLLRRQDPEGAAAVREEPRVPRRRDRDAGARPRPASARVQQPRDLLRARPTASASPPRWAWTPPRTSSTWTA